MVYYARVENDCLYGRLLRLFYAPVVRALANGAADRRPVTDGGDLLAYLGAFRYALAGEFATTGALARRLRAPRGWGLEVGTLGDALDATGFAGTAQVDQYATTIRPPAGDDRLPAWRDADLDPATVASLSAAAIEEHND